MSLHQQLDAGSDVAAPVLKLASVWTLVGITSWAEFASFLASIYTLLLLGDFFWKKVGRAFCDRRGWFKSPKKD